MSHVLAIARREIEERAFVFVAAIAIALVSPLALLTPYGSVTDRLSVVVPLSFILGVAFTWGLALILGGTLVGRELSERRLSFYFTRPLSGAAIWFGKLFAAALLLASAFAIVHAFPLGFGEREFRTMSTLSRGAVAGSILGIALGLMFAAHVISTWIRSRSPILGLDFLAVVVFVMLLAVVILPLAVAFARRPVLYVLSAVAAAIGIAGIGGGAWQLARGRIDARRNHRELSLFVWSLLFLAIAGSLVYSRWVLGATPRELRSLRAVQQGNFLQVSGEARGAQPSFVVDPSTGAYLRGSSWLTEGAGNSFVDALMSPSLANVLTAFAGKGESVWTLRVARCDRDCAVLMNLDLTGIIAAVGITPDASRVALVSDGILTVYDVPSRHGIASARFDAAGDLQFVSPDVVRIFAPFKDELHVTDFDVRTRKSTAVIPPVRLSNQYEYRVAGPLLMTHSEAGVEVRDLRHPQSVETIALGKQDGVWLMRDGRQAIFRRGVPAIEIHQGGVQQRVIQFGRDVTGVRVSAEIGRGNLLVSTGASKKSEGSVYMVDANTGAMRLGMARAWAIGPWPSNIGITDPEVKFRAVEHRDTGKVDVVDLRTGAVRALFQ